METYFNISAKETDYFQENLLSLEYREIIPKFYKSENFVNKDSDFINDKDVNSEIVGNDNIIIPEIDMLNKNYPNGSQ